MVGVTGFEPATPASRTQCSSQAELHPDLVDYSRESADGLYTIRSFIARVTRLVDEIDSKPVNTEIIVKRVFSLAHSFVKPIELRCIPRRETGIWLAYHTAIA